MAYTCPKGWIFTAQVGNDQSATKTIPGTQASIAQNRRQFTLWSVDNHKNCPNAAQGAIPGKQAMMKETRVADGDLRSTEYFEV